MKPMKWLFLLLAILIAPYPDVCGQEKKAGAPGVRPTTPGKRQQKEGGRYKEWLEKDVIYIITPEEKDVFLKLKTDDEREKFIEQFWLRRDPDPTTFVNEFKEEHYRRIAYVNAYYGSGIPGWKTDRGRIYIRYGPPTQIESNSSGGSYERPRSEGGGRTSTFPFEVWNYKHLEGIGDDIHIEFVDKSLTGQYTLSTDPSEKDALLRVPGLGKTLLEEASVASKTDRVLGVNQQQTFLQMGQSWKDQPFERLLLSANLSAPMPIRFKDLQQAVLTRVGYRSIPLQLSWDHLWIDDHRVLVPIIMVIPSSSLTMQVKSDGQARSVSFQYYGRVINLSGRTVREFEEALNFQPSETASEFVVLHQVLLAPGRYRIEIVLKDVLSNKYGSAEAGLALPSPSPGKLQISSLLLAQRIQILQEPPASPDASVLGDVRIVPAVGSGFGNQSNLGVYFQLLDSSRQLASGGPLEIRYRISQNDQTLQEISDTEGITIHRRDEDRLIAFAFLSLHKLQPGRYTLTVTVKSGEREAVSSSKYFEVKG